MKSKLFYGFLLLTLISCSRKGNLPLKPKNQLINLGVVTVDEDRAYLGPCEPSVAVNPSNTDEVIVGSILDRFHHSTDGGKTWTTTDLSSPYGVYGDPVVGVDHTGKFYYAHLSNPDGQAYVAESFLDRIVVQSSTDKGKSWNDGTFPAADQKKDQDKQWFFIHPDSGTMLMTWTEFDRYGEQSDTCKSRILFSKSMDGAETWSEPIAISTLEGDCEDDDKTTEGASPIIDTEGNYHVVWSYDGKIYHRKSMDKGLSWGAPERAIMDQFGGWVLDIPGFGRANGMPVLKVDNSTGKYRGTLYMNWSDQMNGEDDTDIWLSKSTDGGKTWSDRIKVNDDDGKAHQFFTWMDIDETTGYLYIVFYDRRNVEEEIDTNTYLAYSTDGGETFTNVQVNDMTFKPSTLVFMGDYNNISAHGGKIFPVWTELHGPKLSVKTALIELK